MDEQAFADAVRQNQDMLFRVAYTVLRNPEDCADAIQEALLRGWRGLPSLRSDAAFRGWMARIVVNCSREQRRRRRLPTVELTDALGDALPAPENPADAALADALAALPEGLRLPIALFYTEGMSIAEIGRALRLPQGTVKNRLYRGRQRLAALLREDMV